MAKGWFAILVSIGLGGASPASAEPSLPDALRGEHISISWIAPDSFSSSQETIALLFQPDPGWHVYWKNPGDSGTAPKFSLTSNAAVGEIVWPTPERIPFAHLTNFGYHNVGFPLKVTPSTTAKDLHLEAKLEWLVCQEECIPGFGTLVLDRPIDVKGPIWQAATLAKRDAFVKQLPKSQSESPWLVTSAVAKENALHFTFRAKDGNQKPIPTTVHFFPVDGSLLSAKTPSLSFANDRSQFEIAIELANSAAIAPTTDFLLVVDDKAWEFTDVAITTSAATSAAGDLGQSAPDNPTATPLFILFLSAFVGGLILNLMPCVLPVLSLKFLSLARQSSHHPMRHALAYTGGVLVTFVALGAGVLLLRAAGSHIGWGFQLQSPSIVIAMALLFWLMGLHLLGVFEFGVGTMNIAGRFEGSSAFASGILAVFVAAPCTGPFMGTALGATATLAPIPAMLIFIFLGLGLAAPFVLLAAFPALSRKIPKPGPWMETLKQFLAFPLFATVIWLLWVLGMQLGNAGWLLGLTTLLLTGFFMWMARSPRARVRTLSLTLLALCSAAAVYRVHHTKLAAIPASAAQNGQFVPYDRELLEQTRQRGQAVFVDFTAAWCISCQFNKQAVLDTDRAAELFSSNNVFTMLGDWTNYNDTISQALAEFGRNSVPLYVYYPPNSGEPRVLPQLLTISILEDLFKK